MPGIAMGCTVSDLTDVSVAVVRGRPPQALGLHRGMEDANRNEVTAVSNDATVTQSRSPEGKKALPLWAAKGCSV